ncbi:hypothetical protein B0T16DRAFT_450991 [Cercophora newfieldiana]|uniref:DUF7924 domain-containing protein n=1 Tax=Cercophora newfieldiana TaxID=92897 RepID=A0AA39YMI1_9PEZI|nr:hypothetical protein B0T16DRAFT_450991 [Cercophora newfieldiana]
MARTRPQSRADHNRRLFPALHSQETDKVCKSKRQNTSRSLRERLLPAQTLPGSAFSPLKAASKQHSQATERHTPQTRLPSGPKRSPEGQDHSKETAKDCPLHQQPSACASQSGHNETDPNHPRHRTNDPSQVNPKRPRPDEPQDEINRKRQRVDEPPAKRPRDDRLSKKRANGLSAKRIKSIRGPRHSSHFPPAFWDNLSKVWLTHRALREFDRRNDVQPSPPSPKPPGNEQPFLGVLKRTDAVHEGNNRYPKRPVQVVEKATVDAKPDFYDRARLGDIDKVIREELDRLIIPTRNARHPVAPNFFLGAKGPDGSASVAKRQACYDGAYGARAMQALQGYGSEPAYDGNAYTYSSTYQDGLLQIYAHHTTMPTTPGGQPEYHMTKLRGFDMTDGRESFVQGATAFRNARDIAKQNRDSFIATANARARQPETGSSCSTDLTHATNVDCANYSASHDISGKLPIQHLEDAALRHGGVCVAVDNVGYSFSRENEDAPIPQHLDASNWNEDDEFAASQHIPDGSYDNQTEARGNDSMLCPPPWPP